MTKQRETRESVLELIEPLAVGAAIPSERQLGVDLGVSRLTVRAALDELVREGYLVRRRGAGTFVAEPKVAKGLDVSSFSDDMRARGLTPASHTLDLRGRSRPARGSAACSTSRRRSRSSPSSACGSPTATRWRSSCCTSARRSCPGMTAEDLEENSFYDLLANRYDLQIAGGTQTVEPTVTNDEESAALGVPLHSPALLFERITRASTGDVIEFTSSTYRGDRYRLVTELGVGGRPAQPLEIAPGRRDPLISKVVLTSVTGL